MGVDLLVRYKGKMIADLGRKHMYSFLDHIPESYEEVEGELKSVREQVMADIMAFSGSMTSMDYDKEKHVELINEMVMEIKESLEWLEEESTRAGRVMTLLELGDDYNEGIEVIDEIALEMKEKKEKKEEEEYWKRMDNITKSIDEAEEADAYDAVEHQTSEVDLTCECNDLKDHKESIEEIGYCSECRKIEEENDEYLDRQNRN